MAETIIANVSSLDSVIDKLPTAEQFKSAAEKFQSEFGVKKQEKKQIFAQRAATFLQQNEILCDRYKEYLLKCVIEALEKGFYGNHALVRFDMKYLLKVDSRVCPAHFIHYGNFESSESGWQRRKPFVVGRNPFRELQMELFKQKKLILLDESDNTKGHLPFIYLYGEKPAHYLKTPLLWHKYNRLQEDVNARKPLTIERPKKVVTAREEPIAKALEKTTEVVQVEPQKTEPLTKEQEKMFLVD